MIFTRHFIAQSSIFGGGFVQLSRFVVNPTWIWCKTWNS